MDSLRAGREPDLDAPLDAGVDINLHVPVFLPDDYVPDVHLRLMLYKRISGTATPEELRELQVELIDRFGLLPDAAKNLMRVTALKQRAATLGVEKIDAGDSGGYLLFGETSNIDPVALVQLVQNESRSYRLQGTHRLAFRLDIADPDARFRAVEDLLGRLATAPIASGLGEED